AAERLLEQAVLQAADERREKDQHPDADARSPQHENRLHAAFSQKPQRHLEREGHGERTLAPVFTLASRTTSSPSDSPSSTSIRSPPRAPSRSSRRWARPSTAVSTQGVRVAASRTASKGTTITFGRSPV